ncbi:hypothetical protein KAJ61_04025, partial [Candidatus Parcubacteria bacterium]|nr:hypothetical protein [Candidatus Parcubacteria bacterium]
MFNYFQQSIKLIAGFIIVGFFLFCLNNFNFKMFSIVPVQAKVSSDAIAIRVIPNPEHYSALRWYKKQGFSGSPQSLIVDGYGAVRDGRTVYVNAANIAEDGNLYTNIYLILYNQEAGATTQDIFSRILSHWEFNTNISDPGQCNESDSIVCVIDFACPINEYCLSDKSEIIRDTKRLADLADMKDLLAQYKKENNRYPSIRAGSYLPNKTISAWPSWQSVLAQELKTVLSEDPINKLGDCGDDRFNPITCWDEQNKEFADTDLSDSAMNLPVGSEIYVYSSAKNGESYEVCAVMESGYVSGVGSGACDSSESINIDNKIANSQPIFKGINLPIGYSGEEYLGLIEASDPDGDILSWNIDTS